MKGTSTDADCPEDTAVATVGTFTVTVVSAEVKAVTFTTDHAVLTDYTADYAGGPGNAYNPRGWRKSPAANNPITHTKGMTVGATVLINVCPEGVAFDLAGVSGSPALTFHATRLTSTGMDQPIPVTSDAPLAAKIDILNQTIVWTVTVNSTTCSAGTSGEHKVYVLWDTPVAGDAPTLKRVNWAALIANGATSITSAAAKFKDAIAANPGYSPPRAHETTYPWLFLDSGQHGDCITLAIVARKGLGMAGISAQERWSYPTADGSPGWPTPSGSTCHSMTTTTFQYQGQTFNARLAYPGNNYEGFFTVSDPAIKAYTAYPPGGPFEDPTFYYLEVLASVTSDQMWVWNSWPDPYQTSGGVTVYDGDEVPGASHIPVPAVP